MAITAKLITETSITVMMNGKTYILTEDNHQHYTELRLALKQNDIDTIEKLIDMPKAINRFGEGKVVVVDGVVTFNGEPMHNATTNRMLRQMDEGFDVKPMVAFMENLMKNPSMVARDELYLWLEANNNPITEDGCFIAFKRVRPNFKDHHSGTIDNSVGQKPSMDRSLVDDNRHNTCSAGLHFASESYIPHFHGNAPGHTMILKVNPADVVSIPVDYGHAKGRCWQYEVIGEVENEQYESFYKSSIHVDPNAYVEDAIADDDEHEIADDEDQVTESIVNTAKIYEVRSYDLEDDLEYEVVGKRVTYEAAKSLAEATFNDDVTIARVRIVDANTEAVILVIEEELDDQPVTYKPAVVPGYTAPVTAPKVVTTPVAQPVVAPAKPVVNQYAGVLFTKSQTCAILNVTMDVLDDMLAVGTKVERVTRGGKNWVQIK